MFLRQGFMPSRQMKGGAALGGVFIFHWLHCTAPLRATLTRLLPPFHPRHWRFYIYSIQFRCLSFSIVPDCCCTWFIWLVAAAAARCHRQLRGQLTAQWVVTCWWAYAGFVAVVAGFSRLFSFCWPWLAFYRENSSEFPSGWIHFLGHERRGERTPLFRRPENGHLHARTQRDLLTDGSNALRWPLMFISNSTGHETLATFQLNEMRFNERSPECPEMIIRHWNDRNAVRWRCNGMSDRWLIRSEKKMKKKISINEHQQRPLPFQLFFLLFFLLVFY